MSLESKSVEEGMFKQRALTCLGKLRALGKTAKEHIDLFICLTAEKHFYPNLQYIAASILTESEIMSSDNAEFDRFSKYLDQNPDCSFGVVHHNRTAVLINSSKKYSSEHGECRLFDHSKQIKTRITTSTENDENRYKGKMDVLGKMADAFRTDYPNIQTGIILLFSVNIPCTIEGHECAKLLYVFAEQMTQRLIVSFDKIHTKTNKEKSLEYLKAAKITVFRFCFCETADDFINDLVDYQECVEVQRRKKQKPTYKCRSLTKEIQANWSILRREAWAEM